MLDAKKPAVLLFSHESMIVMHGIFFGRGKMKQITLALTAIMAFHVMGFSTESEQPLRILKLSGTVDGEDTELLMEFYSEGKLVVYDKGLTGYSCSGTYQKWEWLYFKLQGDPTMHRK